MRQRFAYRPPAGSSAVLRVDLFGETSDWRNGIALAADDGAFAAELELPAGVYQYKLRVERASGTEWLVDPAASRTRAAKGLQNSIVVVDGAPEPWLFAPAPPWVVELARGGIRVLVGLRRDVSADAVTIGWSEDGGASWSTRTALRAFEEDEHLFFVATLPVSTASILLALEAAGTPRWGATPWTRARASERLPRWWKTATIYGIFVDRFRPAADHDGWENDPGKHVAAGGHLEGIRRSLPELADLGIDTLYLTPVHDGASAHRYDLVDPLVVDPALGGEEAYLAMVRDARSRGMRIIQDVSFAHAGAGFAPYEDVRKNGSSSRWASWFVWNDGALVHYGKRKDAPLLDQTNPEVQGLALEAVALWAKRGAAGLRLDMTAEVPIELGRRIRRRFRELVPDGIVFGEIVPQHAWRWRAAGVVDAATDFDFHEVVTELTTNPDASAEEAFGKLARTDLLRGGDPLVHAVRFLSTHDHTRLATLATARGTSSRLLLAYALLATLPGVPMLLYGEEIGLRSSEPNRDPEDVWPDRMPMAWTSARRDPALRAAVRDLLRARRDSAALREGSVELLFADATTLVFRRQTERDIVDVALNFDVEPKTIELEDDEHPRLLALASFGHAAVAGAHTVTLPPCSGVLARRESAAGRAVVPMLARRNLALVDQDLVRGAPEAGGRPSRFLFSVTERCNLRCAHCITHAPERTESGSARTMTPAVLAALAGDFGFADYFAFVHGGESLTAPIFFDVLGAIGAARGAEPWVAHLLTNGVKLDVATATRLVEKGVSSISVSLDGATPATNDAIRLGGRFLDIRENLRRVLAWRVNEGVDLRIGISCVVLSQNLAELTRLVDLGADLGVDWIKLEEGVPATAFARRSLVAPAGVRDVIDDALARGRARGLVMVDHTVERAIWRCRLEPSDAEFLHADETANRTTIHPCRMPWETVCVEPNGDVRIRDFFGPILGNVTERPLVELWNGTEAQRARRDAVLARLCGSGPVVCVDGSFAPPR